MKLKILVTAGDGIGPEVTNEAVAVLKEVAALGGHELTFTARRIGGVAIVADGTPLPGDTYSMLAIQVSISTGKYGAFIWFDRRCSMSAAVSPGPKNRIFHAGEKAGGKNGRPQM